MTLGDKLVDISDPGDYIARGVGAPVEGEGNGLGGEAFGPYLEAHAAAPFANAPALSCGAANGGAKPGNPGLSEFLGGHEALDLSLRKATHRWQDLASLGMPPIARPRAIT